MDEILFYASKLLKVLTDPASLALLTAGLGAALLWSTRTARLGRWLVLLSIGSLLFVVATPLPYWWIGVLEKRFPRPDLATMPPPDGIVVLGGALAAGLSMQTGTIVMNRRGERVVELAMLARRYPAARVIYSGGAGDLAGRHPPETYGLKPFIEPMGLPPGRVIFEERSRNTFENAAFTKELANPQPGERWLLVTSGSHMPRSVGVFRAVGWPVIPFPVDFESPRHPRWVDFSPARKLSLTEVAAHETIGMIVYYLTGHSASLFPGPELRQ